MKKRKPFARAARTAAPVADRRPNKTVQFGETRVDDYAWLRADNWQEVLRAPAALGSDIRAYLEAENAYYKSGTAHIEPLREKLFGEMRGRIREDDSTPPAPDGPYSYFSRFRQGGEYPVFVRTPRDGGAEEILYDGDAERGDAAFFDIGDVAHSPDHSMVAYAADRVGSEYFDIRVRVIETGAEYDETVSGADSDIVWAADSASFFYIERDENQRPKRVRRHVIGEDPAADELIYDEPDDSYFLSVSKSRSGVYVFITASKGVSSEVRFLRADAPPGEPARLVAPREEDMIYFVEHCGDDFYIHTNAEGAVDFKIMKAPAANPARANWTEWLPARAGVFVVDFLPFKDRIVRLESVDALPRIVISDWSLKGEREIDFDEAAFALGLAGGYEFDTGTVRFTYESPSTPRETYDYSMDDGTRVLVKRQEVPSGHNKDLYTVERFSVRSPDGAETPVTVLRLRETPTDGSAPLLLYGYGSYGVSIPASFNPFVLGLVDRGAAYAVAHIRGGADKGRQWYLDGKLEKKPNTFGDFIAVAEALHARGLSTPARTVIFGGSAGGLLVGAVVNQRPDLFGGVIAAVPFVDVLNTISDEGLPLTPPEWVEWGDPVRDEAAFRLIKSYSPYDNVRPGASYPPMLITGGLADYRVTYWEPAKWTARLRALAKGGPFFLRMDMEAGHGGAAARFERMKEYAEYYAFALEVFGRADADPVSHF